MIDSLRHDFQRPRLVFTGGAGGKHTWGALGSELYAEVMASSQDDPNYDSDSQVN